MTTIFTLLRLRLMPLRLKPLRLKPQSIFSAFLPAFLSVFLLGGCVINGGYDYRATDTPRNPYEEMVQRVFQGDWAIDFLELRREYQKTPYYLPVTNDRQADLILREHFRNGEFGRCVKLIQGRLHSEFPSLWLHNYAFHCHKSLGNKEQSFFHQLALERLLYTLTGTGDGRTKEFAFQFISLSEAYDFFLLQGYNIFKVLKPHEETPPPYDVFAPEVYPQNDEELFFKVLLVDQKDRTPLLKWVDVSPALAWAKRHQAHGTPAEQSP